MGYFIGQILGCMLIIYALSLFTEWALTKRVTDNAITGKVSAVAIAAAAWVVLYGFGSADGGPWDPSGVIPATIAGFTVGALRVRAYRRWLEEHPPEEETAKIFE